MNYRDYYYFANPRLDLGSQKRYMARGLSVTQIDAMYQEAQRVFYVYVSLFCIWSHLEHGVVFKKRNASRDVGSGGERHNRNHSQSTIVKFL